MIPSPLLVVTDRHGAQRPLVETVRAVLAGGARWIWFRDKDMEPTARRALAIELLAIVREAGGRLTIGADAELAAAIGADGIHLGGAGEAEPMTSDPHPHPELPRSGLEGGPQIARRVATARARLGARTLVGISAHSVSEIRKAAAAGADYATLSPIFSSPSKPGYGPALGLDVLRETAAIGLPVIALGGVDSGTARLCLATGAAGVAVMGSLMRAEDPETETRRLLAALGARP